MQRYQATVKSVLDERSVLMGRPASTSQQMVDHILNPLMSQHAGNLIQMRRKSNNNFSKQMKSRTAPDASNYQTVPSPFKNNELPTIQKQQISSSSLNYLALSPQSFSKTTMQQLDANYSPYVYFKLASEYQKMNENKVKTQLDLKNYLMQKRVNEQKTQKLEEKITKIEKQEKDYQKDLRQKISQHEEKRRKKLQRVFSEAEMIERKNQKERNLFNEERWKKLKEDEEREKELSKLNKLKQDKEIELKDLHLKKREELNQKEIETCLSKLNEINNKMVKSNQIQSEKKEERAAYLKAQQLLFEMKKQQAKKINTEETQKRYEQLILRIASVEDKKLQHQKQLAKSLKKKFKAEQEKFNKVVQHIRQTRKQEIQSTLEIANQTMRRNLSMGFNTKGSGYKSYDSQRSVVAGEDDMIKQEMKKLKDNNIHENLQRELKKLEFKKMKIIEKENAYSKKIKQKQMEKAMIDKCKTESFQQALMNKEKKMKAIFKLKDMSVTDRKEKIKTKKIALKLAGEVDLEDVFKEPQIQKTEEQLQ